MLAIVAAVLFAITLILDLAGTALGPLDAFTFVAAGLLCLALQLARVGASSTRSWRRSRLCDAAVHQFPPAASPEGTMDA